MADLLEIIGADAGLKFGAESPPGKIGCPPPKKKRAMPPAATAWSEHKTGDTLKLGHPQRQDLGSMESIETVI